MSKLDITQLKFDSDGLIPAIVQDGLDERRVSGKDRTDGPYALLLPFQAEDVAQGRVFGPCPGGRPDAF